MAVLFGYEFTAAAEMASKFCSHFSLDSTIDFCIVPTRIMSTEWLEQIILHHVNNMLKPI